MNTFINELAREYFCEYLNRRKEENLEFKCFRSDDEQSSPVIGAHSDGVSGRILFTAADQRIGESPRLFVKFLSTEDEKLWPGCPVFWFRTEIHFFAEVAPMLDSLRSIRHLIPRFLHSKDEAGKMAIAFDHLAPKGFVNADQKGRLDYAHLSLMARKIGEFHGYSFAARKLAPGQLEKAASLPVDSYTSLVTAQQTQTVRTLRRALEPLGRDPQYADAVLRIERRVLADFVDSVTRAFSANSANADFVLCHRSYSQSNVMFRYASGRPVDLVIMDWQTVAFASLGVDLGLVLYLEASQGVRDQYWDRLLDDYRASLSETFSGCEADLPSKENILQQLRISAATTLNMLAYKVHQSQTKSGSDSLHLATWNDGCISEVLRDMARRNLI
ncbi:hypothetical protein V9T40_007834 [Parthenolecanium corni]|uniref:CHK kinase-like domain-containing protein n=1 Tax=Parthenolecanium corni TaxID=536013 RepID=A0AAN9Y519_9HEMI